MQELSCVSRCGSTWGFEAHHKRREGGSGLDKAEVLCHSYHISTSTYGVSGDSPPSFSQKTKDEAMLRAGNRCECERKGCGH